MISVLKQYFKFRSVLFFALDGFLIFISVPLAILIRQYFDTHFILTDAKVIPKGLLFTAICQTCLFYNDLYTFRHSLYKWEHSKRLIQAIGAAGIIITGVTFLFREVLIGRGIFITSLVICPLFLLSWRYVYGFFLETSFLNNRVVIVGSGSLAKEIGNEIVSNKSLGFEIVAFIDENPGESEKAKMNNKVKRDYVHLFQMARNEKIDQIIVALSERRGTLPVNELLKCKMLGVKIEDGISMKK
jgi:FlaA1/EpsC-like NDP-sugar epimerase